MLSKSTGGTSASLAISAEEIIDELIISDDIENLREHLREMLDAFLLAEDDELSRRTVFASFLAIDKALHKVEQFQKATRKTQVA